MRKGVPINEVLEAITGRRPDPIELSEEGLRTRREAGEARRSSQITDEAEWLEQLARFRENGSGNGDKL